LTNYTPGFERWWECYPSYRKKGKGGAFKIWKRDGLEKKKDELIAKLQEQVDFDEQFQGKYVPMPTTYLNQNRYDDPVQKPTRIKAKAPAPVEDIPREECAVQARVNSVARNWLWRRGGIPDYLVPHLQQLVRVLASDVREELRTATDAEKEAMSTEVPKRIRENLNALANDGDYASLS